ncbi:aspartate aminotransferase family protein [Streptomyces sp. NPDC048282]|uniref:aspartate aminotransferase family protein n=1 Tax=Streptomyces sp. NPDC048282 TaxID=3365528 RepID=UPI00371D65CB
MSSTKALMARRHATLGPHSLTFYDEPLQLVSGVGVWLRGADGVDYLDAYNNVPHVGHCNPVVVQAIADQAARLNIHTRYLHETVVEYAEALLETFASPLDRVSLVNSGSEANELALRIARQHTGHTGVLVSDFSYHGNTTSLAVLTTALTVREPLGAHVRALRVPDLDNDPRPEGTVLAEALAQARAAVDSLVESGHGVSAFLFDPLFSTEGLPRVPAGYLEGVVELVRAAGGLVVADEVQSGFGRTGTRMWGHELFGLSPELVTLGKPMGNGHPLGAVVTTPELLDEFGAANLYFNTFAGNPVSAAAGLAVLREMDDLELQAGTLKVGDRARVLLEELATRHSFVTAVKGTGLFFGLEFTEAALTKRVVEDMRRRGVLISRVGRHDTVLKVRPPLVFGHDHLTLLADRLAASLDALEAA